LPVFRRVQEIEASRAAQVLQIEHGECIHVSSSEAEDDDLSDEEITTECSEPFCLPELLPQSELLPDIESGQHFARRIHIV